MKTLIKKHYKDHKETIHNFVWRSLQIFGKQGITFLIFILCAKLLTPYEFGIYNYALAIIFFLIMFGDFGISTATSKYVAEYNVTNKNKLKSVLFNSGIIILGLTILITILTLIIGPSYLKDKYVYILWLLPLIFLAPMTSLYDGIYRGLKKFKSLAIISLVIGFVSIFFVYFLIKQYGLIGALISQNLFYLILLIGLGFGYREFHFKINKDVMKKIGKYSLFLGIINLGYLLYTRIDIIILGHFNFITEIGYYELINKYISLISIPFLIFANIEAPNIVNYFIHKKINLIKYKIKKTLIATATLSAIAAFLSFLIFQNISKYLLASYNLQIITPILYILLISFIFTNTSSLIGNTFVVSTGHAKLNMYNLILFGILNLIFDIYFIKNFGFMGLIYSKLIIFILGSLSLIILYYKKIDSIHSN